jgi:hypothetical protein
LHSEPVVRFKLVSLDEVHFRPGEVMRLGRHPLMVAFYLVLTLFLVAMNANSTVRDLSPEWRVPVYLFGTALGTGFVIGCLRLAEWRAGRIGRMVTVHGTPVLFGAALFALFGGEALTMATTASPPMGFVQGLLLVLFYWLMAELGMAFVVGYLVPRALDGIRGVRPAPRRPGPLRRRAAPAVALRAATGVAPPAPPPPPAAPVAGGTVTPLPLRGIAAIHAGNRRYLVADIQRIEAEGNYVRIVTPRSRDLHPGPFSRIVAQMPPAAGQVISRSCWIAADAVVSHRRIGRDLLVRLADGTELRVASTRRAAVMDWLQAIGARQAPTG